MKNREIRNSGFEEQLAKFTPEQYRIWQIDCKTALDDMENIYCKMINQARTKKDLRLYTNALHAVKKIRKHYEKYL